MQLRCVESIYAYKNMDLRSRKPRPSETDVTMKLLGSPLIFGDFLARSVRGLSCAPPSDLILARK